MAGDQVKCRVCKRESADFCTAKKCKVAINKPRLCDSFIFDSSKVKITKPIAATYNPFTGNELRAIRRKLKQVEAEKALAKEKIDDSYISHGSDPQHPLTGDLSRFTSTATK